MSTYSQSESGHARKSTRTLDSQYRRSNRLSRFMNRPAQTKVEYRDAYLYALRAAYLHHLLQPRPKRKQYISNPKPSRTSSVVDVNSAIRELSGVSAAKSAKIPKDFMHYVDKRIQGVLVGKERMPGYNDATVKRVMAEAYTAFTEKQFRKTMEQDRRLENMVLIFYTSAVKALKKGLKPEDDSWKGRVDRHVALFVRLLSSIMREEGWDSNRTELMSRLATLEKKLLTEDQDLSSVSGVSDTFIEVTAPISYDVKDMHLVQIVVQLFGMRNSQVQSDLDAQKSLWTEEAALTELKSYQQCVNTKSPRVMSSIDFDIEEGYQAWKRTEMHDLSQMMLDILHVKPELAKSSGHSSSASISHSSSASISLKDKPLPAIRPVPPEADYYNTMNSPIDRNSLSSFSNSQPVDMSGLSLGDEVQSPIYLEQASFIYLPSDPRAYFRSILTSCLDYDKLHAETAGAILSKKSLELLTELAHRWRIPLVSRMVLFIDVIVQRFKDSDSTLDDVDAAFGFISDPPKEPKNANALSHPGGLGDIDTTYWTIHDYSTYRNTLTDLHDALLRDLYNVMQDCYGKKPELGPVLYILETHVYKDRCFSKDPEQLRQFASQVEASLRERAAAAYRGFIEDEVPHSQEEWTFAHVVQLGRAVMNRTKRIQKRFATTPDIVGVEPFTILVQTIFPSFENDANDIIRRIMEVAQLRQEQVDVEDGFDLYRELVEVRRIHHQVLPSVPFAFHIETVLADFVWRWISSTSSKMNGLVEQAIAQDNFEVRKLDNPEDSDKHSVSIQDLFQLFNQTTQQITNLNWDDDILHAKFTTALSKTFGEGLARYCEILEQKFSVEMARLTPAQEAAMAASKQDRWMKIAKDAWNNKEKVEPFQFYPSSLVKFNNIEYAIQRLDQLERMMNVDACAEVLEREKKKDPSQRSRGPNKYVFTIKIVEAEDLKAMDANGYSDPYVVLVDEHGRRLTKTRVINKSLNPRWDESIDITLSGTTNMTAFVWDCDLIGEDDFIGRASLKLDPSHFSDYLPKECWLQLDTQGKLLLRINMEGERDDIQFYFGKAFRMLKRTERDMVRKITEKLSTYMTLTLSHDTLRSLLSRNQTITSYWKSRSSIQPPPSKTEIEGALNPLTDYFNDNFAILNQTLTTESMNSVMTRLWKEVLIAIESLLVPPLSDKPSSQRPLGQVELDIVLTWMQVLFEFFNARDPQTGKEDGVKADVLMSSRYYDLKSLAFFYNESTENLVRTSERMASATAQKAQQQRNRLSAPANLTPSLGVGGMMRAASTRRAKSILLSRNLGTMKKAKEEKRKESQAEPNDDMILRILRMRPEPMAAGYLRDRSRQRERLAAAAAAEEIVRQSMVGSLGGGFHRGGVPRR